MAEFERLQITERLRVEWSDKNAARCGVSIEGGLSCFGEHSGVPYFFFDGNPALWPEHFRSSEPGARMHDFKELTNGIQQFALYLQAVGIRNLSVRADKLTEYRQIRSTNIDFSKVHLSKPEIRVTGTLKDVPFIYRRGITGVFSALTKQREILCFIEHQHQMASLPLINTFNTREILLAPQLVGIICHEAIGHMVEADHVIAGSCMANQLGEMIAPEFVTIVDNGGMQGGSGQIDIDDEGIESRETVIIANGRLNSYLHNTATADHFGVKPTGNSRAGHPGVQPSIRMTNTYMLAGSTEPSDLLSSIKDGVYLNGHGIDADVSLNGKFRIRVLQGLVVRNGTIVGRTGPLTLESTVFNFLCAIKGLGNDFTLSLGTAICGKHSNVKVDAGGPSVLVHGLELEALRSTC